MKTRHFHFAKNRTFSFCLDKVEFAILTMVSISANMEKMKYSVEYFHVRVKHDIESWPDGILADYARLVELLMEIRAKSADAALACNGRRTF